MNLASDLNLSMGIPELGIQSRTADKFDEYADELYKYTLNNIEELLSINENDGYHVGMAFSHIIEKMPVPESRLQLGTDNKRLKISLNCAVICLWRGIQMRTMQSVIATHELIKIIDKYKTSYFERTFVKLTGLSLLEIIEEKSPNEVQSRTDKVYKLIKYYLIQLTRAEDAFKDANMKACELGEKLMKSLHDEMCDNLSGYISFGII